MTRGDTAAFFNNDLAIFILYIKGCQLAAQTFGYQFQAHLVGSNMEHISLVIGFQNVLRRITQRTQQNGCRQFTATVNTYKYAILGVELKVQPRATVRNHAGRIQQLARTVSLAAIVVEEYTRRTVKLGNNHALGTINNKGTVFGHQRDFSHIDFLLFDILDFFDRFAALAIKNDQMYLYTQRSGVGNTTHDAFFNIKRRLAQPITHILKSGIA